MIHVTRINRKDKFWINENLIEFVEEAPDTIVSMATGRKIVVAETAEELDRLVQEKATAARAAAAIGSGYIFSEKYADRKNPPDVVFPHDDDDQRR